MQDGSLGRGAYFTSNWDGAAEYAKEKQGVEDIEDLDESKVLEVFLNVRDENNITHSRFYRGDIEVLATNPNQIKSATDNIGTFDNRFNETRFRSTSPIDTARLPNNEEVIYRSEEITPEQQSLLNGNNPHQYTAERELSEIKDTRNSLNNNYLERIIAQVESEVNTTPPRYKPPPPHNRPKDVCRRLWITLNQPPAQLGVQQPTNNNRLQRRETSPPNQTLRCSCDGELTPKTNFRTKKRISTRNRGTAERRSLHCRFKC